MLHRGQGSCAVRVLIKGKPYTPRRCHKPARYLRNPDRIANWRLSCCFAALHSTWQHQTTEHGRQGYAVTAREASRHLTLTWASSRGGGHAHVHIVKGQA